MSATRKRLASSFVAFQKSLQRRRDLIVAIQHDLADLDSRLQAQQKALEEDEDEDDEDPDPRYVVEQERQRLLKLYRDPKRRNELEGIEVPRDDDRFEALRLGLPRQCADHVVSLVARQRIHRDAELLE